MEIRARLGLCIVLGISCLDAVAFADEQLPTPAPEPTSVTAPDETPWGKGVSAERRSAALQLMNEGNELFLKSRFPDALTKYELAIAQWDHPAIHFNMVRALVALDRPLAALESLDKALAYGAAPLEDSHYNEALEYKSSLASRVGTLEIACKQPGVRIQLDGADVLACPGQVSSRLLPGNHVVVGTKAGHQTSSTDIIVIGGASKRIDVRLATLAQVTEYRTRWATWMPWTVGASGVAVAGIGFVLRVLAKGDLDALDDTFQTMCQPDCTRARYEELGLADDEARIETQSKIAVGTMIAGGVIAATGVALIILNRPQPYVKERRSTGAAQLLPTFTPQGGGLAVVGRF